MLKRIRIFALIMAVAVICVSVLPACRDSAPEDESYDSYVYCLNADRTGLVKVEYDIPDGKPQEQAEQILEKLKQPSDDL